MCALCMIFEVLPIKKREGSCSRVGVGGMNLKADSQLSVARSVVKVDTSGLLRCCSHISSFYPSQKGRDGVERKKNHLRLLLSSH